METIVCCNSIGHSNKLIGHGNCMCQTQNESPIVQAWLHYALVTTWGIMLQIYGKNNSIYGKCMIY